VSWTATHNKDLFTTMHSRVVEQEVVLGGDHDGRLRVLAVNLRSDVGSLRGHHQQDVGKYKQV